MLQNRVRLFLIVVVCLTSTGCVVAPSQPQQNRYTSLPQPKYTQPLPPSLAVQPTVPSSDSAKADSVPIGYEYFVQSADGKTKYYMHSFVQSRSMELNPNDMVAVADIWVLLPNGNGVFYKQGSDCKEPGSSFLIKPSPTDNGKLIRADQKLSPPGTIGFGMWSMACIKAGLFNQKPAIKNTPLKKTS